MKLTVVQHNSTRWPGRPLPALVAVGLVAAALVCTRAPAAGSGSQPLGALVGWGKVAVDQMPSPPGTLLFSGDVVTTEASSGAEIRSPGGSIARIDASSEVAVAGRDLELRQGSLTLKTAGGTPGRVRVLGATVTVGGALPSTCLVQVASAGALVAAEQGSVTILGAGAPSVLRAGQLARLGMAFQAPGAQQPSAPPPASTSPPASAPITAPDAQALRTAGRVVAVYPDEVVRHPGSEIATPLRLGELVDAGDVIGTMGAGRARVLLLDDTLLDLGLVTTLRVVDHNPEVHTTELDLTAGHLGAQIPMAAGVEPRFVVKTELLELSAAATLVFVSANSKEAVACNAGSGQVTVRSPGSAPGTAVKVGPTECSITRAGEALGASRPDRALMEREMNLASFEGAPGIPELVRREAYKKARVATYSGVAALTLVSFIEFQQTTNDLNRLVSDVQPYLTALGNSAANSAIATELEHNLCLAFLNFAAEMGHGVSPSAPSQTCPNPAP